MNEDPGSKWFLDRLNAHTVQLYRLKDILYSTTTQFQSAEIIRTYNFGISLVLDGKIQSSEADEFVYHEALVHPPMLTHPCPESVFIAGGGEGATLREVLAYSSIKRVVMVDLDREVVELCRQLLFSWHQGAFEDNRVELIYQDARKYLTGSDEKFDVIILDLSDPLEGGPSYLLYTEEFYRLTQQRLTPQGILSVQAGPCAQGDSLIFLAIVNTLRTVFPQVFPYQTYISSFGTLWGFSLASFRWNPCSLSTEEIDRRISARIGKDLQFYDGIAHQGIFSLPKYLRQELSKEKRIITDANPLFLH